MGIKLTTGQIVNSIVELSEENLKLKQELELLKIKKEKSKIKKDPCKKIKTSYQKRRNEIDDLKKEIKTLNNFKHEKTNMKILKASCDINYKVCEDLTEEKIIEKVKLNLVKELAKKILENDNIVITKVDEFNEFHYTYETSVNLIP